MTSRTALHREDAPRVSAALALALLVLAPSIATAAPPSANETERVVVGLHDLPTELAPGSAFAEAEVVDRLDRLDAIVVETDAPESFAERVERLDQVRYAEPDRRVDWLASTPDDPLFDEQHAPQQAQLPAAWNATTGSTDATVCVVDTGVRYTHEDLQAGWLGGFDVVDDDGDPMDENGHGTHVSGIAAARLDSGRGIAGAGNVGLIGARALGSDGGGTFFQVAEAITRCAERGADVISMSIGAPFPHQAVEDAVENAHREGSLLVAAAGNRGCVGCVQFPAKYEEVMAVGCTDTEGRVCEFSARGEEVDLVAPGEAVLSTWNTTDTAYARLSGTSQSTAWVAGVAALAETRAPLLSNTGLRQLLTQTAEDRGEPGEDPAYGDGALDANRTVHAAKPTLSETFDDGDDRLATSGAWHVAQRCAVAPSAPAYMGYHADAACRMPTEADNAATVAVDLSSVSSALLQFSHRFEVPTPADAGVLGPSLQVQARAEAAGNWTSLASFGQEGSQANWTSPAVDLSGFAGSTVEVRFTVEPGVLDPLAASGWHVDDLLVVGDDDTTSPPPEAAFEAFCTGSVCTFDASASTDDTGIERYEWRFGDGETGQGRVVEHAYDRPGIYEVELTVRDAGGASDTASQRVLATGSLGLALGE